MEDHAFDNLGQILTIALMIVTMILLIMLS